VGAVAEHTVSVVSFTGMVVPLAFMLLVVMAALIVPFFFPAPAPARYGVPGTAMVVNGHLVWKIIRLQAMFAVYKLTEDPKVFPTGRAWFWSGWGGGKAPPEG
jgi:hypothetical protein